MGVVWIFSQIGSNKQASSKKGGVSLADALSHRPRTHSRGGHFHAETPLLVLLAVARPRARMRLCVLATIRYDTKSIGLDLMYTYIPNRSNRLSTLNKKKHVHVTDIL